MSTNVDDNLCDNIPTETHLVIHENQQMGELQCTTRSISVPSMSELAFDNTSTPATLDDNGYQYSQDSIVPTADSPSPYCTPVTEHYYVNFVKPADSLVLLFNQIKQTNVKDISRSSIK